MLHGPACLEVSVSSVPQPPVACAFLGRLRCPADFGVAFGRPTPAACSPDLRRCISLSNFGRPALPSLASSRDLAPSQAAAPKRFSHRLSESGIKRVRARSFANGCFSRSFASGCTHTRLIPDSDRRWLERSAQYRALKTRPSGGGTRRLPGTDTPCIGHDAPSWQWRNGIAPAWVCSSLRPSPVPQRPC
jgi:hypothetical protein